MEEQGYQHRNKDPKGERHRFSDLQVRMRKLDSQESGEKENRCFQTMALETNTTHSMDINGHKQDDPRGGQTKNIA